MRFTKPTGTWLLLWPCWWSIALSTTAGALPPVSLLGLFGAGAVLLRSSGCIINDIWDKRLDAKVERTKDRPLAANQVSPLDAVVLLHGLNACGLLVILQFDLHSIALALSSMALVVIYPACKRFTNYPQVVLGMAFNWGALLGWSAACGGTLDLAAVLPLYLGGICWTLVYDTLYAHQDVKDDLKLGLKSTAIKFGDQTARYLNTFAALMTASLTVAGLNTGQCWPYYLSVAATGATLYRIISKTDINNAEQCGRAFRRNFHIGWMLFAGIVLSTLLKEEKKTGSTVAQLVDGLSNDEEEGEGGLANNGNSVIATAGCHQLIGPTGPQTLNISSNNLATI